MDILTHLNEWLVAHGGTIGTVGVIVLEVVFRVWPSDKVRSILSYAGRLLQALGTLIFKISDLLGKIVPDHPAAPKE